MVGQDRVEPDGLLFLLMILSLRSIEVAKKSRGQDHHQEEENRGERTAISLARAASDAKR